MSMNPDAPQIMAPFLKASFPVSSALALDDAEAGILPRDRGLPSKEQLANIVRSFHPDVRCNLKDLPLKLWPAKVESRSSAVTGRKSFSEVFDGVPYQCLLKSRSFFLEVDIEGTKVRKPFNWGKYPSVLDAFEALKAKYLSV